MAWGDSRLKIFLVCIIASTLRMSLGVEKQGYEHDEQISLLESSCNYPLFNKKIQELTKQWVSATEWKQILIPPKHGCFDSIAKKLSQTDMHPPLYFWTYHVTLWTLQSSKPWVGPFLNSLFAAFTALLLIQLFRRTMSDNYAILTALLWSMASGPIFVSYQARQYELLTLLTVALIFIDTNPKLTGKIRFILYTLVITLGGLTHYQFGLMGFSLLLTHILLSKRRKHTYLLILAAFVSIGLVLVINPSTLITLSTGASKVQGQTPNPINRLYYTSNNILGFFAHYRVWARFFPAKSITPLILLVLMLITYLILFIKYIQKALNRYAIQVLCYFSVLSLTFTVIYVAGFIAEHTMRYPRYLGPIYPLLAFAIGILFWATRSKLQHGLGYFGGLTIGIGVIYLLTLLLFFRYHRSFEEMQQTTHVLIDTTHRGEFITRLLYIPDEAQIYVDQRQNLLKNTQWLDEVNDTKNFAYGYGFAAGKNSSERQKIVELIKHKLDATKAKEVGLYYIKFAP